MSEGEFGFWWGGEGQLVRERSEGLKSLLPTKAGTSARTPQLYWLLFENRNFFFLQSLPNNMIAGIINQ